MESILQPRCGSVHEPGQYPLGVFQDLEWRLSCSVSDLLKQNPLFGKILGEF